MLSDGTIARHWKSACTNHDRIRLMTLNVLEATAQPDAPFIVDITVGIKAATHITQNLLLSFTLREGLTSVKQAVLHW